MRTRKEPKTWTQRILGSKLVLTGSLILLVLISVALGKAVYRRYQIQREIEAIKQEIGIAEGKNQELAQLIEYLSTDAFREKMARQRLNLKKEGETVIIIPAKKEGEKSILGTDETAPGEEKQMISVNRLDNPKKWWYYFFSNN